jgi:streptomycin 6-kinase
LTLGEPFDGGVASVLVAPAVTADGEEVVLKVQKPHRESEHEAAALELWDGDGAVRLLAHDSDEHALLLERCVPGTPLAAAGAEAALDVFVELLPRLWKPAGEPFRPLAEEAAWWAGSLSATWERAGRPFERRLLDAALDALHELPPSQGQQVLLHQDLHGDNVLAAQREPWLAIDPKPLAGEREFGIAPIVRSFELGHSRHDVLHRFDRLTGELGLDRERARGWTVGQTIAWAFDSSYHETHVQTVRWLLEGR